MSGMSRIYKLDDILAIRLCLIADLCYDKKSDIGQNLVGIGARNTKAQ